MRNATSDDLTSLLHMAVSENEIDYVRALLDKGADPNSLRYGKRPLLLTKNVEMVKLLIEYGADINAKGKNDETPLLKSIENLEQYKNLQAEVGEFSDSPNIIETYEEHIEESIDTDIVKYLSTLKRAQPDHINYKHLYGTFEEHIRAFEPEEESFERYYLNFEGNDVTDKGKLMYDDRMSHYYFFLKNLAEKNDDECQKDLSLSGVVTIHTHHRDKLSSPSRADEFFQLETRECKKTQSCTGFVKYIVLDGVLANCVGAGKQYIILDVILTDFTREGDHGVHANILAINIPEREIVRYEPHGGGDKRLYSHLDPYINDVIRPFLSNLIDDKLRAMGVSNDILSKEWSYRNQGEVCIASGLQAIEGKCRINEDWEKGYCLTWSLLFHHMLMENKFLSAGVISGDKKYFGELTFTDLTTLYEMYIRFMILTKKIRKIENNGGTFEFNSDAISNFNRELPCELMKLIRIYNAYIADRVFSYFIDNGSTPLHELIKGMLFEEIHERVFDDLLNSIDINAPDSDGNTVLHIAAKDGKRWLFDYLKDRGIDFNAQNNDGNTALHLSLKESDNIHKVAMRSHFTKIIENMTNLNIQNNDGNTPLHLATKADNEDIVRELINRGADVTIKNKDGKWAITYAFENNNMSMADLFDAQTGGSINHYSLYLSNRKMYMKLKNY